MTTTAGRCATASFPACGEPTAVTFAGRRAYTRLDAGNDPILAKEESMTVRRSFARAPRRAALLIVALAGTLMLPAAAAPQAALDRKNMDLSLKPGDDFFRYANGAWIRSLEIPADKSEYDAFDQVREQNRARLHELFAALAAAGAAKGTAAQKVGDFYAVAMDAARAEALGAEPLQQDLRRIAAAASLRDIQDLITAFHRQGVPLLFGADVEVDLMNAKAYAFYLAQSGLGMPDRDYYTREDAEGVALRGKYQAHVAAMLRLLGDPPAQAAQAAQTVMAIETRLAKASKTRVEMRDIPGLYNKMALAQLQQASPGFDWARYVRDIGRPGIAEFIVTAPVFVSEMGRMLQEVPLADWKAYLRWQALAAYAPYLSSAFVDENFAFFGRALEGTERIEERWKRMTSLTSAALDQLVGRMYVERYFPPASKQRMEALCANVKQAFEARLLKLPWMSEATRAQALEKLRAMRIEVGYPAQWEDDAKLEIGRSSLLDNLRRAGRFAFEKDLDQLGQPVDTGKWDMAPQIVNAGYNPVYNKMIFPAGILQPPFFFADADDAVNYGAIGMAIGHEMSHGFDDQGRWFDKDGNMRDWWTPEDSAKFKEQTKLLVAQYGAFASEDGVHVNGELSLGENIADYAGLTMALAGYRLSRQGKAPEPAIDGFTPEQRFFLSFAQVWRGKIRPEALKKKILEDVHPWGEFRVNGAPFNVPEFYKIFDIKPGDRLYRAPGQRPAIW
jgi:putative endopeptidase